MKHLRVKTRFLQYAVALACVAGGALTARAGGGEEQEARALLDVAASRAAEKRFNDAEALLGEVLKRFPASEAEARLALADVYHLQGRFAEAMADAQGALDIAMRHVNQAGYLSQAVAAADQYRSAEKRFNEQMVKLQMAIAGAQSPDEIVRSECAAGDLLLWAGRRDAARQHFEWLLSRYPENEFARRHARGRLQMMGDSGPSELGGSSGPPPRRLGLDIDEPSEALRVSPVTPDDMTAAFRVGDELLWTGEFEKAGKEFLQILASGKFRAADGERALQGFALSLKGRGLEDGSASTTSVVVASDIFARVRKLLAQRNYAEALGEAEKAALESPREAWQGKLLMGEIACAMGHFGQARDYAVSAMSQVARPQEALDAARSVVDYTRLEESINGYAAWLAPVDQGTSPEDGTADTSIERVESLLDAGQPREALAAALPRFRALVGQRWRKDMAWTSFIADWVVLDKRAAASMAKAASGPSGGKTHPADVRLQAERWFRAAQASLPRGLSEHAGLDTETRRFLKLLEQSVYTSVEEDLLAQLKETGKGLQSDAARTALADFALGQMLLLRNPTELTQRMESLPDALRTAAQIEEFGDFSAQVKRFGEAAALYELAADRATESGAAAACLKKEGDAYAQMTETGKAVDSFRRLVDCYPDATCAAAAQLQVARLTASEWKSYGAAVGECEKLIKEFPESKEAVEADFLTGQYHYLEGAYDKAAKSLQGAIERHKAVVNTANAEILLALCYANQDDMDRAAQVLRAVAARDSDAAAASKAQYTLGYLLLTHQRYDEAASALRELQRRYPDSEYAKKAGPLVDRLTANASGNGRPNR